MNFFKAITIAQAQNRVDALRHAAKMLGAEVPSHAAAQQLIAKENGYANWTAFKVAQIGRVDALLIEPEARHASDSTQTDGKPVQYPGELQVKVANGFGIRFEVDADGNASFVRVVDPLGREILYYVNDELQEAPLETLRALLVCAGRLHATTTDASVHATRKVVPPTGALLRELSAVVIDGEYYQVNASEPDASSPSDMVLWLQKDEDGLITDVELTLEELMALSWNESENKFYSPDGESFEFFRNVPVFGLK